MDENLISGKYHSLDSFADVMGCDPRGPLRRKKETFISSLYSEDDALKIRTFKNSSKIQPQSCFYPPKGKEYL